MVGLGKQNIRFSNTLLIVSMHSVLYKQSFLTADIGLFVSRVELVLSLVVCTTLQDAPPTKVQIEACKCKPGRQPI